ncbi:MAG: TerD family protein [Clostridia bacterium]|nr:TerD family protein [Clostridia bacterium]
MSVNLQKGQKVNLRKNDKETLKRVMVGLGWDEVEQKKGFFGFLKAKQPIDCDASAILCKKGKLVDFKTDVVFYNNLRHKSGAVEHQGDNLTGAGDGDDEQIFVDLSALPSEYDRIVFVVTIYQASERGQHFGLIENAFIRICDASNDVEFCKFNLSENYSGKTAMIVGEIVKDGGEWKFNALGQPTTDNGILDMAKRFA